MSNLTASQEYLLEQYAKHKKIREDYIKIQRGTLGFRLDDGSSQEAEVYYNDKI
jgi:hypothetical protein